MCRLYEKFILEYDIKHYLELKVSASRINWSFDVTVRSLLPIIQCNVYLQLDYNVLIIVAKYYKLTTQIRYNRHTILSNKMYQILLMLRTVIMNLV